MSVVEIMMLAVGLCFATVAWGHFSNQLPATLTQGLFTSFHFPDLSETRGIKRSYNVETSRDSSGRVTVYGLHGRDLSLHTGTNIFHCYCVHRGSGIYSASYLVTPETLSPRKSRRGDGRSLWLITSIQNTWTMSNLRQALLHRKRFSLEVT
jgi:hypothetical protein